MEQSGVEEKRDHNTFTFNDLAKYGNDKFYFCGYSCVAEAAASVEDRFLIII